MKLGWISVPIAVSPGLLGDCSFTSVLSEGEIMELGAIGDSLVRPTGCVISGMTACGFALQLSARREDTLEHGPQLES